MNMMQYELGMDMNTDCHDLGLIDALRHQLALHLGLHFSSERIPDLQRGIEKLALAQGYERDEDFLLKLLSSPLDKPRIQQLATHLTIGETYFFREPGLFDLLRHELLPFIMTQRRSERRIRLWSVGCSTGEEAYSLAILLDQILPPTEAWDALVLGMDVNPQALEKAETGVYGAWSFRNPPPGLREYYFDRRQEGDFSIHKRIRERVRFSYFNLADRAAPLLHGAADLILCRNVLMYFTPEAAHDAGRRLAHALKDDGYLLATPAEASLISGYGLDPLQMRGQVVHRKSDHEFDVVHKGMDVPQPLHVVTHRLKRRPGRDIDPDESHRTIVELANQGRVNEALIHCRRLVDSASSNPEWHYLLATLLLEQGQSAAAVAALEHLLQLDSAFVMAHVMLGRLYRQELDHASSVRHLRAALEQLQQIEPDIVPVGSDGLTALRLKHMVESFLSTAEASS